MNAEQIKKLRKDLGITQKELAYRIKCTERTIRNLEQGNTRPSRVVIRRLERQEGKLK
ncbi:MAG: helix-turn-helix transcriptional regulator [Bacteroidetes bacterium]|nr:helix-turn-helix transcriptional regulator [Bacteroidota bacterium]